VSNPHDDAHCNELTQDVLDIYGELDADTQELSIGLNEFKEAWNDLDGHKLWQSRQLQQPAPRTTTTDSGTEHREMAGVLGPSWGRREARRF
jgi:hypothetical protein